MIAAMVLIALLYNRQATKNLVEMAESQSAAIDRILSNTIWNSFETYFAHAARMDAETLRARPETAAIRHAIAKATDGIKLLKVKIYSAEGLVVFSSDPNDVGQIQNNMAIRLAVDLGQSSSELSYKDRISAFSGEFFERDVVETYLPRYDAAGNIAGVFELYADVTSVKNRIDVTTIRLTVGVGLIFTVIYGVLVIGVMRRAIAPIRLASRRAAQIGPQTSGLRLPTRAMPREILPLVHAINAALDRLDEALDAQRRFTADAAHELLTPLAVLRTHVDTLDEKLARSLRRDIDAMTDIVRQLLLLSELESTSDVVGLGETTDLHAVALDVVAQLAPLADREDKEIALTGVSGSVPVKGNAGVLARAVRNVVENAVRHTPPGTVVEVDVAPGGTLRVTDQGPGVPPERREVIFQRFWRGERRDEAGAGLGLSIVKRIADLLGGSVHVEDGPEGGGCFVLALRPAGQDGAAAPGQEAVDADITAAAAKPI